ncbi:GMC family oxidoreductase [Actinorugispora endophytica]|uniref:Choline dehydrogenase n=1 Tax=Actinorugispora endophytica TaxID=1605990 RepID=A0A4V3D799_9ACTN|nr:GMC oxidoreductase [Actinorugispora endophytica]TDQ46897.1 choline dehydrogenase [Actinorugispora endophytica]
MQEYTHIIVGGGTAGSVLANRLTEDPDVSVLVLEAGAGWIPRNVDAAPLWFTLLGSEVDWGYGSVAQPGLGGRSTYEPRGRMPGGSSNLYIMMHVRGHPSDFDSWAYQGAPGWSYRDVMPYFARSESVESPAGPDAGREGPQTVTRADRHGPNPTSRSFLQACAELGHPLLDDFNSGDMSGAGWHQLDVRGGRRRGALASYLEPALGRPNLTVRTSATTTRIVVENGRATGVEYHQGAEPDAFPDTARRIGAPGPEAGPQRARATGEVLVCAGAIESPKLLMLSGIGDPTRLREAGVDPVADVPGVGENFHNHVLTGMMSELREAPAQGAQNLSEAALFTRSDPGLPAPDLQIAYVHVPFDIIVGRDHPTAVSVLPGLVRPASRGWVRLAGPDPFAAPLINPNYLADPWDLERMVAAVRIGRDLFGTRAFAPLVKQELTPGPDVTTDAGIADYVRRTADSYHHQAGSCRMGLDDRSVVDPRLRVHGVEGLRVVDAGVMPSVPSGNCHTAVVMIAEKAADLVRGREARNG